MLIQKHTYYFSDLISGHTHTRHGFSLRMLGDMRAPAPQNTFLDILGIREPLHLVRQVHGDAVCTPKQADGSLVEADAIVLANPSVTGYSAAIGIHVADCAPIILADSKAHSIGVVHAGWKGTVKKIVARAIDRMCETGTRREDVLASIGPRIGMCCYTIPIERVDIFRREFGDNPRICYSTNGTWYADIAYANKVILAESGISDDHIDAIPMCTSCQKQKFYSYRTDSKESFGEQIAVIAFT